MKNMTLKNIAEVCRGTYCGPEQAAEQEISAVVTDSRRVQPACLFVPIVGTRADGHDFIPQVMEAGALATLSEKSLGEVPYPYILVESSLKAIRDMAEYYLEQLEIPVVGITGSVGKTSTKEMVASVLKEKYRTLKTQGNFNNELGLPLTVFRLQEEDDIAVLEMGISNFGEMSRLAKIAKPDTCVITNIGTCHLEFLGDRDGVFQAKTEVFEYLQKEGHIVLNGDDDKLAAVEEFRGIRPVFFGLDEKNPVYADEIVKRGLKGMSCRIHLNDQSFMVDIPAPGRHMVYNALAAAAVGRIYGLTLEQIRRGIESYVAPDGRFHMVETEHYLIVDDCYNANPMSMKASLDILKETPGRRVAILGDMGELGEEEVALHEEVGRHAADCRIDLLLCTGELAAFLARAAAAQNPEMKVIYEPDPEQLKENLTAYLQPGDTILVKASHFMHFEEIVEKLQKL